MEAAPAEEGDNIFILNIGSVRTTFKVDQQSVRQQERES